MSWLGAQATVSHWQNQGEKESERRCNVKNNHFMSLFLRQNLQIVHLTFNGKKKQSNAKVKYFSFLKPKLQVNSPYLEDHLMHMIKQDQSKVHNMDLLWRYYEKNRNFGKAAHVLARLADMHRLALLWGIPVGRGGAGGHTVEFRTTTIMLCVCVD